MQQLDTFSKGVGYQINALTDQPGFASALTGKCQGLSTSHVKLDHSSLRKAQDPGLGMGLLVDLWALLCWAGASTAELDNEDWEQADLTRQ